MERWREILEAFDRWIDTNTTRLSSAGFSAHVERVSGTDKDSIHLRLEGPVRWATISVWESGELDVMVMKVDTEEDEWITHFDLRSPAEIAPTLDDVLSKLESGLFPEPPPKPLM